MRYFLANYVVHSADLCSGHLENLSSSEATKSKTLQVAMEAVGLAALSNQRNDASLMAKARHQYAMALRMTKGHLEDPLRCKQDRTNTAVALLGLFEVRYYIFSERSLAHADYKQQVMTCSSPKSLKSWANHINGSIALLNLRGVELLESEYGFHIFTQARSQIVSLAITTCPTSESNF